MDCSVWPRPSARTRTVGAAVVRPRDHATHAVTAGRAADARHGDARVHHVVEVVVGRATPDQEDVEHVVELHTVVAVVVAASHLIVMAEEEEDQHQLEVVHVTEAADGLSHALAKSSVDDGLVPLVVGVVRHRHLYHDVRLHRLWHDELPRRLYPDVHLLRALVIDAQDRVASVRDVFIRLVTHLADAVVDIRGVVSNIAGQTLTIATATTTITITTTTMETTKCSTTDATVPSTT